VARAARRRPAASTSRPCCSRCADAPAAGRLARTPPAARASCMPNRTN
jgi:hypothetical protein